MDEFPGRTGSALATDHGALKVEVAAGVPTRQEVVTVTLRAGATVMDAVRESRILERFPELAATTPDYSIHGVRAQQDQVLAPGDRVEVLRPLQVDPRESRRRRALTRRQR